VNNLSTEQKAVVIAAAVALIAPHLLLEGWVGLTLWTWFAVPLGAPPMKLGHAMGLLIIVGLAKVCPPTRQGARDVAEIVGEMLGVGFVAPLMALVLGWIVKAVLL